MENDGGETNMQMSFFDGSKDFYFQKPIRLIEFFAGYGSQALALNELGVEFQHWRICEWAIKSIQAYKDNHFYDVERDYAKDFTFEELIDILTDLGISANYSEPLNREQVKRLGEKQCRTIYNNIKNTNNLVNISSVKGKDLDIRDTDKYDYVLTYSFPCQDLSKAGKGKGMARDSGTRSGLLWEVERILDELYADGGAEKLPKILLMENVPDVIGTNNLQHFRDWRDKLEDMGYKCYWQVLNAKDYSIPQNRDRCFMVSILGDYFYSFPQNYPLTNKLMNILEQTVDEKYYLSQKAIKGKLNTKFRITSFDGCLPQEDGCCRTLCARDYKDPKCVVEIDEPIACELRCDEGIRTFKGNIMGTLRTIDGCGDKHIIEPTLKEQLCDKLIESGLLKEGMVIESIDNHKINDSQSYLNLVGTFKPGDNITVGTDQGDYSVSLGKNPNNESVGFFGIQASKHFKLVDNSLGPVPWVLFSLVELFQWIFTLNLGIGLFNLLPIKPLDGGYMLETVLCYKISEDKAKQIVNAISGVLAIVIVFSIIASFM